MVRDYKFKVGDEVYVDSKNNGYTTGRGVITDQIVIKHTTPITNNPIEYLIRFEDYNGGLDSRVIIAENEITCKLS